MAAPSWGSVPAPNSSSKMSEQLSASRSMRTMREMWLENVDRLCCRLCSSPMSAWTRSNTATSEPSAAGTNRPAWAINERSPAVFSATVFPPVFTHLDHRQRLDEESRPTCRLVVNDARSLTAGFGTNGNHIAAVPLRDHRVLHQVAEGRSRHDLAQAADQAVVGAAELRANP